jgi:hypothetical protein
MKRSFSLLLAGFASLYGHALEPIPPVRTSNGLELILFVENRASIKPAEQIIYTFVGTNQWELAMPKPEYFCAARLVSTNGTLVPKTRLCETLGKDFFRLNDYSRDSIQRASSHPNQLNRIRVNGTNGAGGNIWYRPNDLFKINQSGRYTLELRFQVFGVELNTGATNYHLERFPLVRIPVEVSP